MNKISDAAQLPNDNLSGYRHLTFRFCENDSVGLVIGARSILRILAEYIRCIKYFDRRKLSGYDTEIAYQNVKKFHYKAFRYSPISTSRKCIMTTRPISAYKFMYDTSDDEEDDYDN